MALLQADSLMPHAWPVNSANFRGERSYHPGGGHYREFLRVSGGGSGRRPFHRCRFRDRDGRWGRLRAWWGQVQADGRDVPGAVPGGANAEHLARSGYFAGQAEASDGGYVNADEIDPAVGHQREPLIAIDEEFSHGERRGGLLAHGLKPMDVFGSEGVFQEEEAKRLDSDVGLAAP